MQEPTPVSVRCVECAHCLMRANKAWTKLGAAPCALGPSWHYQSLTWPRECGNFVGAQPDSVAKRREWLAQHAK